MQPNVRSRSLCASHMPRGALWDVLLRQAGGPDPVATIATHPPVPARLPRI